MITLPIGEEIGPFVGPVTPTLDPNATVYVTQLLTVPRAAPAGGYTYTFNVGTFPNIIDNSGSLNFTKLGELTLDKVASAMSATGLFSTQKQASQSIRPTGEML